MSGLNVVDSSADFNEEQPPDSTYFGVCVGVFDVGHQKTYFEGVEKDAKPNLVIYWELNKLRADGKRFVVWNQYTNSNSPKSRLSEHVCGWTGKSTITGMNLGELIGKSCMITTFNTVSKAGKSYTNIRSVSGLPEGQAPVEPIELLSAETSFVLWLKDKSVDPSYKPGEAAPAPASTGTVTQQTVAVAEEEPAGQPEEIVESAPETANMKEIEPPGVSSSTEVPF